jgi:hypothetical protein
LLLAMAVVGSPKGPAKLIRKELVRMLELLPRVARLVAGALLSALLVSHVAAQSAPQDQSFSVDELVATGSSFFGEVSGGLASVVEKAVRDYGQPNGYILGQEGSGAFVGGLRYGEGVLYTRNAGSHNVFWQGPTLGLDFGAEGSRTMVLVYDLPSVDQIYRRYAGVDGSAYFIGGFGITALRAQDVVLVPVRSGVGARLGLNVGYLKFTARPTWNPF